MNLQPLTMKSAGCPGTPMGRAWEIRKRTKSESAGDVVKPRQFILAVFTIIMLIFSIGVFFGMRK